MLTYKQYLSESVYKLIRTSSGVFNVLDPLMNDTGITLDQNYSYGKGWDVMVESKSKGSFKTKHEATLFIERSPHKLSENYDVHTVTEISEKCKYESKLKSLIKRKTGKDVSNVNDYPLWRLTVEGESIIGANLYQDMSCRKLAISIS